LFNWFFFHAASWPQTRLTGSAQAAGAYDFDERQGGRLQKARAAALSCPQRSCRGTLFAATERSGRGKQTQPVQEGKPDTSPAHAPMARHMEVFGAESKAILAAVQQERLRQDSVELDPLPSFPAKNESKSRCPSTMFTTSKKPPLYRKKMM